ncbi:MAG: cache domain-containing protein, partial [Candidatus Rokuibacteriota bacterium]
MTNGRRFSIQLVLIVSLVLTAALTVLTLAAQRYFWITGEALKEDLEQDLGLARAVAASLDQYMTNRRHLIDTLAQEIGRAARGDTLPRREVLTPLIEAANLRDPSFSTLLVTDRQGVAVAFSPPADAQGRPNIGRRYGDRRWFEEAINAVPQPSYDVVIGKALARATIAVAAPIRSRGEVIGVMSGGLNLDHLRGSVHGLHPSHSFRIGVVDGHGRVIAHSSQEWEIEARDLSGGDVFLAAKRQAEGTISYVSELRGDTRWAAYVRVPATGWVVWTSRGPESQMGKLRSLINGLVISSLLGLAVAAVWAVVVSRFLSRPILALVAATREVSAGRFQGADALRGRDSRIREFKALLHGFAEMADGLRARYEGLEAKVAERTRALEQTAREAQAASVLLGAQEEIQRGYGELASLLNSLDRSYILNEATRKIAASLRAPLVAVYLTENGAADLRLKTYAGIDTAPLDTALLSPGGLPTEVIQRRESIIISAPPRGERLALRTGVGELAISAVAGFPLEHRDRSMGVLAVAMLEPLSEDRRGFLQNAARQLSVALSNAALFESVRYQSQRMEQLNQALRRASE